jgi:hypothetical protein
MHRHLGDDIFWITQAPTNVDKQWRSLTQSYFTCRNFKYERFRGMSKGSEMEVRETLNIPSPHNQEVAQSVQTRKLNKEIAALYNTSVVQGAADTSKKPVGINYKWLVAGIFVVLLGGSWAVWKGSGWAMSRVGASFGWGKKPEKSKIFDDPPAKAKSENETQKQNDMDLAEEKAAEEPPPIPPRPTFLIRPDGKAPNGYKPTTLRKTIMVRDDHPDADRLAVIPPSAGTLDFQGNAKYFGAPAALLDGKLYAVGMFLPDGNTLISVNPPTGRDPLGRMTYYMPAPRIPKSSGETVETGDSDQPAWQPAANTSTAPAKPITDPKTRLGDIGLPGM